jgi:photosystem II stability/assembly factor-like uncharacterized protein
VINTIAVHPGNPDIAYAGTLLWGTWPNTLGNGVFKTTDGGTTWHRSNGADDILGTKPINSISIDPRKTDTLFAVSFPTGVFRSTDGGASWRKIFSESLTIGFALSKSNPAIMYALALQSGEGPTDIYRSSDGGESWSFVSSVPGGYQGCAHCYQHTGVVDPLNPNVVFVGTSDGVFKSRDGGQSWEAKSNGLTRRDITSIAIHPSDPAIIYTLTGQVDMEGCYDDDQKNPAFCGGIYKSTDGGEHWQGVFIGLFDPWGRQLAMDPTDPNTLYAAISHRLYKSSDSGLTWRRIYWRSIGTDDNVASVAPFNRQIVYTGLFSGVIKSVSGGNSWKWSTQGIDSLQLYSLAVDPTDPKTAYTGSLVGGGVYKTIDGGQSWTNLTNGLFNAYIMQLSIAPGDARIVLATTNQGLFKSTDAGATWKHIENEHFGFGFLRHTHLHGMAIDPRDSNVIFVGGGGDKLAPKGGGMFKSTDGGKTWSKINRGFTTDVHVSWVVIDPSNSQTVYVATQGWVEGWDRIGNGSGIFKSIDGGQTWQKVNNGIMLLEIGSLAIDPRKPQILFAGDEEGNIYKTVDGAASWQWLTKMAAEVGKIAVDRNNPATVYAAVGKYKVFRGSLGDGVWRTTDGGKTWQSINDGLVYKQVFNVEIGANSSVLYAATGGRGVFRTPLNSSSAAVDDAHTTCGAVQDRSASHTIQGVVTDGNRPLAGAAVRIQATQVVTSTDAQGGFTLAIPPGFPPQIKLTAWKHGYFNTGLVASVGNRHVELTLTPYPREDNAEYVWQTSSPGDYPEAATQVVCSRCHARDHTDVPGSLPSDQWQMNAHAGSAVNPRFSTVYNGTDILGGFPVRPGYKLDFPGSAGNCATCHAPGAAVSGPWTADMNRLEGVEKQGVFCDFCHKIYDVRLNAKTHLPDERMTGTLAMELRRPAEGSQLFFGPYDDVDAGPDSFLPLQTRSEFCAPCHNASFSGVPVYQSFAEWLSSPYAEQGVQCQDCHMRPDGISTYIAKPGEGALRREPATIYTHHDLGVSHQDFMKGAADLELQAWQEGERLKVTVSVVNSHTGHHLPTDHPMRNILLLVAAIDGRGQALPQLSGEVIPEWGGKGNAPNDYAGRTGKAYAKILEDTGTGEAPTVAYWRQTRIKSDTRVPALATDVSTYEFRLPDEAAEVRIKAQLIFRRAFKPLADLKKWDLQDLLMKEQVMILKTPGTH